MGKYHNSDTKSTNNKYYTSQLLPPGSHLVRLYDTPEPLHTHPPYFSTVVLIPLAGKEGHCEALGLTCGMTKDISKILRTAGRDLGYSHYVYTRYKEGRPVVVTTKL